MTLKENKTLALEFFDAIAHGDVARINNLMTNDGTWWVSPSTKFSGLHQKKDFLRIIPRLFAEAAGPLTFRFDELTAEEDRVSMTAKGHLLMKSGQTYQCEYHFLIRVRDGKIAGGKEYLDSVHVNSIFGPPQKAAAA
jgi:uncharacterized protein